MLSPGQQFYSTSALTPSVTRADILAGRVIKLSPALITLTDGRIGTVPVPVLQRAVLGRVDDLGACGVHSWHVDITFADYGGFGGRGPDRNAAVFSPEFVEQLIERVQPHGGWVTLHLLTGQPAERLRAYAHLPLGAVCFQLDAVREPGALTDLVAQINGLGACASPVIETVGNDTLVPDTPERVQESLEPVLTQVGMLTLQAAGTAARTSLPAGLFAHDQLARYLAVLRPGFGGTIQVQGGITTQTIGAAAGLGAEFIVVGTQLFHSRAGLTAPEMVAAFHAAAADGLLG